MNPSIQDRLAVCSWSLQPDSPQTLFQSLEKIDISRLQIALDPIRENPDLWGDLPDLCRRQNVQLVSGMFVTAGEDYSSLESIQRTGGVVPDATWDENWKNIEANARIARTLDLKLVTFHAGFLPHDETHPQFTKLLDRIRLIADLFGEHDIHLGFETGQETADLLELFLKELHRSNVGVNFDPANMLLYDKGDPIDALRKLGPRLKQCHLKDANRTSSPGTWGQEVPVGSGQVDWPAFFRTADEVGFAGFFAFEREAGSERVADIKAGHKFVLQSGATG